MIRPFPSSKNSQFAKTFLVKMSVICMRKKIFFISSIASHLASLRNRGLRQLENGQLNLILCFLFFLCFFLSSNEGTAWLGICFRRNASYLCEFSQDDRLHFVLNKFTDSQLRRKMAPSVKAPSKTLAMRMRPRFGTNYIEYPYFCHLMIIIYYLRGAK